MRTARMTLIAAATTATAALLLSGCAADRAAADASPDGATGVAAAPTPVATAAPAVTAERTRAAFVADTTPLCDALIAGREAKAKEFFPSKTEPPTVAQTQGFYEAFAPTYADFALGFAKVAPAAADSELYSQVRDQVWFVLATLVKAGQDEALSKHLLDTDEAELHGDSGGPAALGMNPEC